MHQGKHILIVFSFFVIVSYLVCMGKGEPALSYNQAETDDTVIAASSEQTPDFPGILTSPHARAAFVFNPSDYSFPAPVAGMPLLEGPCFTGRNGSRSLSVHDAISVFGQATSQLHISLIAPLVSKKLWTDLVVNLNQSNLWVNVNGGFSRLAKVHVPGEEKSFFPAQDLAGWFIINGKKDKAERSRKVAFPVMLTASGSAVHIYLIHPVTT